MESLALGLGGAAGGVLLGWGILKAVLPMAGESIPRIAQTSLDTRVVLSSILTAVATSALFSLAPAIQVLRPDLAGTLKEGAADVAEGRHRFQSTLVIAQISLGLVLLIGAQLLMSSFLRLMGRDRDSGRIIC